MFAGIVVEQVGRRLADALTQVFSGLQFPRFHVLSDKFCFRSRLAAGFHGGHRLQRVRRTIPITPPDTISPKRKPPTKATQQPNCWQLPLETTHSHIINHKRYAEFDLNIHLIIFYKIYFQRNNSKKRLMLNNFFYLADNKLSIKKHIQNITN